MAALEKLGRAYREATQLIEDYYVAFHQETQLAAQGRSPCPELQGVAVLEKNTLIDRVQQPLSAFPTCIPGLRGPLDFLVVLIVPACLGTDISMCVSRALVHHQHTLFFG